METSLSAAEYLIALRHAGSFTKVEIQRQVVSAACLKNGLPVPEDHSELDVKYREALTDMGYVFARFHEGLPLAGDALLVPTFDTTYEVHYVEHESHDTSTRELGSHKARVKRVLDESGFGHCMQTVIVTNDFRSAFATFFPELAPAEHVTWYVLARTASEAQDHPHGGFFYNDGLPCLMVSPPTPKAKFDVDDLLDRRVCHETMHYLLNHLLFKDGESPYSTKVLEVAGETVAMVVMTVTEELFALLLTSSFYGDSYFDLAPTEKLEDLDLPSEAESSRQMTWLREKERRYLEMQDFLFSSPWACACRLRGLHDSANAIISNYPAELADAANSLVKPLKEIYRYGQLIPLWVVDIVQTLESTPIAPYVSAWESMSKLFAAYRDDDDWWV